MLTLSAIKLATEYGNYVDITRSLAIEEVATKGTKANPARVIVRAESYKNKTLSITLTKSVLEILGFEDEIKKGDVLAQWVDPATKTIYLRKVTDVS